MTWNEFYKMAKEHYNNGGDGIVECWTEQDFNEYIQEFGEMTKETALAMFSDNAEVWADMTGYADTTTDNDTNDNYDDYCDEYEVDDRDSDWRPGDSPWTAPGMSPSDFI